MSVLNQEANFMQNPALGALLLWRFAKTYADSHAQKLSAPLPLAFIVLPLVWHPDTAELIASTQTASGLRKYAGKFSESEGARDVLLAIDDRVTQLREKSRASLRVALATGLVGVTPEARLFSKLVSNEQGSNRTLLTMADNAEKLAVWFSPLTTHEVSLTLHVSL
jgi:hypothetical protein